MDQILTSDTISWDGLYGSLTGNAIATAVVAVVLILVAIFVLKHITGMIFRIIILGIGIAIFLFFATRTAFDWSDINRYKDAAIDCGAEMLKEGLSGVTKCDAL